MLNSAHNVMLADHAMGLEMLLLGMCLSATEVGRCGMNVQDCQNLSLLVNELTGGVLCASCCSRSGGARYTVS
jgi:hypothetical protein